ncbi:unnamed protein product [Dimorphilus gyrociliatus]|uniref:Uncharacterized protein n=1 Tax=Dimorphilus gyrociliatus TaxID=2664684 RepID=A0A7I8V935_9ANNE|nr:unnamed protein product [Dimorphilus gyrociliatus]
MASPKENITCPICLSESHLNQTHENESAKKHLREAVKDCPKAQRIQNAIKVLTDCKMTTVKNVESHFEKLTLRLQEEKQTILDSLENTQSNYSNYLIQLSQTKGQNSVDLSKELRRILNKETLNSMFYYREGCVEDISNAKIIGEVSVPDELFEKSPPALNDISSFIVKNTTTIPECTWFFVNEDGIYTVETIKNLFSSKTYKVNYLSFKTSKTETLYQTKNELGILFAINGEVFVHNVKNSCIHLGLNSGDVIEQKISTFSARMSSTKAILITCLSLDKQTVWLYKGKKLLDIFHLKERIESVFPTSKGDILIVKQRRKTVFWLFKTTESVIAIINRSTKEITNEFTTVQQKLFIQPTIDGGVLVLGINELKVYSLDSKLRVMSTFLLSSEPSFLCVPTHSQLKELYIGKISRGGGMVQKYSPLSLS